MANRPFEATLEHRGDGTLLVRKLQAASAGEALQIARGFADQSDWRLIKVEPATAFRTLADISASDFREDVRAIMRGEPSENAAAIDLIREITEWDRVGRPVASNWRLA